MRLCFDSFFRLNIQFVFIAVILSLFYIIKKQHSHQLPLWNTIIASMSGQAQI